MFRPTQNIASEVGLEFIPDTKVKFYFRGDLVNGTIVKQMTNSAIVSIVETNDNKDIIFQTNGNMVVSYDDLAIKN